MGSSAARSGSSRRLTLLLLCVIVPPALALVWLGVRLLEQDRELLTQRETERREAMADAVARSLLLSVQASEQWIRGGALPRGAARVVVGSTGVTLEPLTHALWAPRGTSLPEAASEPFVRAEALEFQRRGDRGLSTYAALSRSDDPRVRAGAILRAARVHRALGNWAAAIDAYGQLSNLSGVAIAGTPADLIARRVRCEVLERLRRSRDVRREAAALRDDLLNGRWALDRASWELAAGDVARWLGPLPADPHRHLLSAAAEYVSERAREPDWPRSGRRVITVDGAALTVVWERNPESLRAVLIGAPVVDEWVRSIARRGSDTPPVIALVGDSGERVFGTRPQTGARLANRSHADTGLPWTLLVSGDAGIGTAAELRSRRRLLSSGLAALSLLLGGASYLLWRVVRREVAVARLQTDFVAAVSHEFRTPLTSLRHITELLQEDDDMSAERRRSFYSVLGQSTERLHRLVESLLDFARMEEGRRPWDLQPLHLGDLLSGIVAEFRGEHPARTVSLVNAEDWHPAVAADREALGRAIWNLLDNAAKYSPDGGPIDVVLSATLETARIEVRDRGLGISPDERREIFGRFVRGARVARLGITGTGLGLAMVSHIVGAHGGRLHVESEEGRGSTFTIVLPLAVAARGRVSGEHTRAVHVENSHR